jgi:heme-degrading monooxygenase HmoA
MHCRVLEAKLKPGRAAEAIAIIGQQADKVQGISGFAFVQAMHNGDDLLVVSSWRTEKDVRAYADSELAQEMLKRLSSLFEAGPTIKNFAIELAVESAEGFFTQDEGGEG